MFTKDGVCGGEWKILSCFIVQSIYCLDYKVCEEKRLHKDFDFRVMYHCRMINIISFHCAGWSIGYCSNILIFPGHATLSAL